MHTYTLARNINIRGYRGQEWAFDPCGIWLSLLQISVHLQSHGHWQRIKPKNKKDILSTSAEIMEWKGLKGKGKSMERRMQLWTEHQSARQSAVKVSAF